MCISPQYSTYEGRTSLKRCRVCWQCRNGRVTDWVGRCIAEASVSTETHVLTLTYGDGDHIRAVRLVYRDIQKMLKRLRKDGYKVRYAVSGEFGTQKGRAHWHCVLFFRGAVPPLPPLETKKQHWHYWQKSDGTPRGFVYRDTPTFKSLKYACYYAVKALDKGDGQKTHEQCFHFSTQPALGSEYFAGLAQKYVEQGLAPKSTNYPLPRSRYVTGRKKFYLTGQSRDEFARRYLTLWREKHGERHYPHSEWLEQFEDREARKSATALLDQFISELLNKASPDWTFEGMTNEQKAKQLQQGWQKRLAKQAVKETSRAAESVCSDREGLSSVADRAANRIPNKSTKSGAAPRRVKKTGFGWVCGICGDQGHYSNYHNPRTTEAVPTWKGRPRYASG